MLLNGIFEKQRTLSSAPLYWHQKNPLAEVEVCPFAKPHNCGRHCLHNKSAKRNRLQGKGQTSGLCIEMPSIVSFLFSPRGFELFIERLYSDT